MKSMSEGSLVQETVRKGGESWLEMTIDRRIRGVEMWVRCDPRVEEFIAGASDNKATDDLETYGRNWYSAEKGSKIKVYRMGKLLDTPEYTFENVGGSIAGSLKDLTNLSFFRFVGIGSPEGIRFILEYPMTKEDTKKAASKILTSSRRFFADHIVPLHIELRISSQEV